MLHVFNNSLCLNLFNLYSTQYVILSVPRLQGLLYLNVITEKAFKTNFPLLCATLCVLLKRDFTSFSKLVRF